MNSWYIQMRAGWFGIVALHALLTGTEVSNAGDVRFTTESGDPIAWTQETWPVGQDVSWEEEGARIRVNRPRPNAEWDLFLELEGGLLPTDTLHKACHLFFTIAATGSYGACNPPPPWNVSDQVFNTIIEFLQTNLYPDTCPRTEDTQALFSLWAAYYTQERARQKALLPYWGQKVAQA